MGIARSVPLMSGPPDWAAIAGAITARTGEKPVIQMIDGLPAFPDELPESGWRELRISLSGGVVTLRHEGNALSVVVWGNADAALLRSADDCILAIAAIHGN